MTAASLANARRGMAVEQVKECGGGGGVLLVMHGDVLWRRMVKKIVTGNHLYLHQRCAFHCVCAVKRSRQVDVLGRAAVLLAVWSEAHKFARARALIG